MFDVLLLIGIGMLIGWNIPQPQIVKEWTDKAKAYLKG